MRREKYRVARPQRKVFTKTNFIQNQSLLRELPGDHDARLIDVHRRNEILKQNKLYNLDMERRRMFAALQSLPPNAQQNLQKENLQKYINRLEDHMFSFTRRGRVPK